MKDLSRWIQCQTLKCYITVIRVANLREWAPNLQVGSLFCSENHITGVMMSREGILVTNSIVTDVIDVSQRKWRTRSLVFDAFVIASVLVSSVALACGDETGLSCALNRDDARYMLKEAVKAVDNDEADALRWFTDMSHGFRTEDLMFSALDLTM